MSPMEFSEELPGDPQRGSNRDWRSILQELAANAGQWGKVASFKDHNQAGAAGAYARRVAATYGYQGLETAARRLDDGEVYLFARIP